MKLFAERGLYVLPPNQEQEKVIHTKLELFEPSNQNGKWKCLWRINQLNGNGIAVRGSDKLDAFLRAICAANDLIAGSINDGYLIWWDEFGNVWEDQHFAIIEKSKLKGRFSKLRDP